MKKTIYYLSILIIILSCSEKKPQQEEIKTETIKSDTVSKTTEVNENELEIDSDCVFDNNYKKITAEWLNELGFKNYVWDSKSNKASIIYNGDTLTVFRGGCNHFISSVEISTTIYPNKALDSMLLKKINDVACKFKFDNYCKNLKKGKFKKIDNENSSVFLEFEDDNQEDNLISEGILISEKENRTIIKIAEYYD